MQKTKTTKATSIILIIIILFLLVYGTLFVYKRFMKIGSINYSAKISKNQNVILSDEDKVKINEKLQNTLQNPLRIILNFEKLDINYDTNLLDEEKNSFEIVWQNMINSEYRDKFTFNKNSNDEDQIGSAYVNLDDFKNYYETILNKNFDEQNILSGNIYNGIMISNNNIYGSYIDTWNNSEFVLKTNSLVYNKETGIYKLKVDFLTKVKFDNTVDYDEVNKVSDSSVIDYSKKLKYSTLEVKYKEKENNYQLISLIFKK